VTGKTQLNFLPFRRRAAFTALLCIAAPMTAHAQVLELGDDGAVLKVGGGWPTETSALAAPTRPYSGAVEAAAAAYDLSPHLLDAVARSESGYNAKAVSPAGAIGVMQLMPQTAKALGVDPRDPAQNIMGGARYLRAQLDRFDGNIDLALAAYNAGPGRVVQYRGVPPFRETQAYVATNLSRLATSAEHAR
jgi:soluble lytic murein transglycosylase-like protein